MYTYNDILAAYLECRKRKRNTIACTAFDVNFEHNLVELLDQINNGTYQIGPSRVFVVTWPKPREVWAAQFRDRIVHHLVCKDVAAFYIPRFIHTNCACIEGRGTLYAVEWLERYCRSITENWSKEAYALQFDIANFFVSIDKQILWDILVKDLGEQPLLKQILFHKHGILKPGVNLNLVPRQKSLWYAPEGKGLPIGDLPSQLCASGVYMNGLDQFCKHVLKIKHYVRYVDDGVALFHTKAEAQNAREQIDQWLQTNRLLKLSSKKTRIYPVSRGINFVGQIVLPFRRYVRRMTVGRAKDAVRAFRINPMRPTDSINSYLGLLQHAATYAIRKAICEAVTFPGFVQSDKQYTKIFHI